MTNPLLETWNTPFEIPPFEAIEPVHFLPAFEQAFAEHLKEVEAIATNAAAPTFENTIDALELSGEALDRVASVFYNLSGANTSPELQDIEREMAPLMARHSSAITMNDQLFQRVKALVDNPSDDWSDEQRQVLKKKHEGFVRSGAALKGKAKERYKAIAERLAFLGTQFAQNVLADENGYELVLDSADDLAGLSPALISAAKQAAEDRGHKGKWVITLSRSSIEPFLQSADRRDLREIAFKAWSARGEGGGKTDNRGIVSETIALRSERADLLGFDSFADYKLDNQMAKKPDAVNNLLMEVWQPAKSRANQESDALTKMAAEDGINGAIKPWDWRYYSEKRRKADYDFDASEVKPYLSLDRMIEAAFGVAGRLFGIEAKERHDLPKYHEDVRTWEITNAASGETIGIFLGDYFMRPSKRSGAWMSGFREQKSLGGKTIPLIVNVMNFAKAPKGEASLLTFDDARTLFHEFGHGLHGLLSNVTYPSIAGTSVARDFVELPSQLYEHWLSQPDILREYAVHHETGEAMPQDLLDRLKAAENYGQGFATVEYLSTAIVDLAFHELDANAAKDVDVSAFEKAVLNKIDMPQAITMRHRPPHLAHAFAGDGYSAGYYSYMWSEVMDADAFGAFEEAGDIFDAEVAAKLKSAIYSAGGKQDPGEAYLAFRGRLPSTQPLLEKRGLI